MQEQHAAKKRHLTADELAERFSVDRYAVYQLVRSGSIPAIRIGRRIRFRLADVEAWEAAGGTVQRPRRRKGVT